MCVLWAAKDPAPARKDVAWPPEAPVAEIFMVLEAMACIRYLVIAVQESVQIQELTCFVDGPVQEEQLL